MFTTVPPTSGPEAGAIVKTVGAAAAAAGTAVTRLKLSTSIRAMAIRQIRLVLSFIIFISSISCFI
jgi:hypothetical protein